MAICINCGVELEEGIGICPLCGMVQDSGNNGEQVSLNTPSYIIQLHRKENRKYLWELSGIIAFSGVAVCTIVNLLISRGLEWALFADVFILAGWTILTLFLFIPDRMYLLISGLLITILGALFFIDLIGAGRNWFIPIGLPVTLAAAATAGLITVLYRAANLKGLNIMASALVVLAGFCIITEMATDRYLSGSVNLRWSLITGISVLPVALVLFFYHYRLKKGNRLESFFHI